MREPLPIEDRQEICAILDRISIFGGLRQEQLERLFPYLRKALYTQGEFIFRRGDEPSQIYIVLQGMVRLLLEGGNFSLERWVFGPGECFGETNVIGILPHTAAAQAMGATRLLLLSRQALLGLQHHEPDLFALLILNIARETSRRLHSTDDVLLQYARESGGPQPMVYPNRRRGG